MSFYNWKNTLKSELLMKSRQFFPNSGFLSRPNMTQAVESDIKNPFLPSLYDDEMLFILQKFGEIDNVHVVLDKSSKQPKGCGFVSFIRAYNAAIAMETCDSGEDSFIVMFSAMLVVLGIGKNCEDWSWFHQRDWW